MQFKSLLYTFSIATFSHLVMASLFSYQHNGVVSPSPWLIFLFCLLYLFPPLQPVQTIFGITDYIGSSFLRNNIIAIYHFDPYRFDCVVSHHLAILFQRCITVAMGFFLFLPSLFVYSSKIVQPLVRITDFVRSTFLRDHIIAIYYHFIHDPCRII